MMHVILRISTKTVHAKKTRNIIYINLYLFERICIINFITPYPIPPTTTTPDLSPFSLFIKLSFNSKCLQAPKTYSLLDHFLPSVTT